MALMKCKYQLCCGYLTSHFCGEPTNGGGGVCGEVCHSICMDSYYKERNFISSDSRCFECAPNENDGDKDDKVVYKLKKAKPKQTKMMKRNLICVI
jgi:hypothetical protein